MSSFEVAKKLGISISQVREFCRWGKFPKATQPYKNGPWLIPHDAVIHFRSHNPEDRTSPSRWDKVQYVLFGTKARSLLSALAIILGLFLAAISAGADVAGARRQLLEWGIITAFPPARNDETLIVISEFRYSEGIAHTDAHTEIKRAIQQTASDLGIEELRVEILPLSLRSDEKSKAMQFGERYNATMIIWGEDTGLRVTISYLTIKPPETIAVSGALTEVARTQIPNPEGYSQFVVTDLPAHLAFLALFANGQVTHVRGNRDAAIDIIETAVTILDTTGVSREGVSATYWALAFLYHSGKTTDIKVGESVNPFDPPNLTNLEFDPVIPPPREDLEQAIHYYDLIAELAPNAYTVGIVYYNRGFAWAQAGEWDTALSDFAQFYKIVHPTEPDPETSARHLRSVFALALGNVDLAYLDSKFLIDHGGRLDCDTAGMAMSALYSRAFYVVFPSMQRDTGSKPDTMELTIVTDAPERFLGRPNGELYYEIGDGTRIINANNVIAEFTKVIELSGACGETPSPLTDIRDIKKYTYFFRGYVSWFIDDERARKDYETYVNLEDNAVLAYYDWSMRLPEILQTQEAFQDK